MRLATLKVNESSEKPSGEWEHLKSEIPLALGEFDKLGKYLGSNFAMAGMLGLSEKELNLLFQDRLEIIKANPSFTSLLKDVLGRTTRKTFKVSLSFKDAPSKLLMGILCSRGSAQGHVMSLVDVTRERDLTAQLRSQESILRGLIHSNEDIILEVCEGKITHQIIGAIPEEWDWKREQYEDAFHSIRAKLHVSDAFRFDGSLMAISNKEISNASLSCRLHIKDDHYQKYQVAISRSQEDNSSHILFVFKKCEEREGAKDKDGLICRFISHEIKNMMTVVQLESARGLSLTHSVGKVSTTAKIQRTLKNIHRTSERLTALVCALESIKRGEELLDIQPINLQGLLEEFILFIGKYLKIHDVKVYLECREDLILKNNSILIQVVLMNLVKNAMESMSESESRSIQIKAFSQNSNVVISVSDSGKGIAPEMVDYIFKEGRSSKGSGRGLGLYLSLHLAQKLGGALKLVSATPACFEMTIPNL